MKKLLSEKEQIIVLNLHLLFLQHVIIIYDAVRRKNQLFHYETISLDQNFHQGHYNEIFFRVGWNIVKSDILEK